MIYFANSYWFGCFRGCYRYGRRRKRVIFAILVFTCLCFPLLFETSAMQQKKTTFNVRDVAEYSHQDQEAVSFIEITSGKNNPNTNPSTALDRDHGNIEKVNDVFKVPEPLLKGNTACPKIAEEPGFRDIVEGAVVYSVWFDDRKSQHFIRILMLTSKWNLPSITCFFKSALKQETFSSKAWFYEHNENHANRRFGAFVASCPVPQTLDSKPCLVNISATIKSTKRKLSNTKVFQVRYIGRQSGDEKSRVRSKYGICIPPVHGDVSVERIIEFLELAQILGASHFTFYDFAMSEKVRNVLKYYQDIGLVSVFRWNLPSYTKDQVHYFAQPLAVWECLFRSMRHLDFVAFHDLDEFIVPLRHENISALLEYIHKEKHCGHCFESVLFDPSTDQNGSHLITQRDFHRTSKVTPYYTKCIVDPRRIFEQGIHHISKPNEEFYHADKVNWNIARVFHYRKCKIPGAQYNPGCSAFIVDKTMQKFGDKLLTNFKLRMKAVVSAKQQNA